MDEPSQPPAMLGTLDAWRLRLATLGELWRGLVRARRYWMLPMLLVLGLLGVALTGLQAMPYVAPFIYAVF